MTTHKTTPELLNNLPYHLTNPPSYTGYVKGIQDTENIDAARHNRSIRALTENLDYHDYYLRRAFAEARYEDLVGAGLSTVDIAVRMFTGDIATIVDEPRSLLSVVRLTDRSNNPLVVTDPAIVFVDSLLDAVGGNWITQQAATGRTILDWTGGGSGPVEMTFYGQTITITVVPPGTSLDYVYIGDTLVISGGTSNDGVYEFLEQLAPNQFRVRSLLGSETLLVGTTEVGDVIFYTNQYFGHRIDVAETYDVRLVLSEAIPLNTPYRVHYGAYSSLKNYSYPKAFFDLGRSVMDSVPAAPTVESLLLGTANPGVGMDLRTVSRIIPTGQALKLDMHSLSNDPFGSYLARQGVMGDMGGFHIRVDSVCELTRLRKEEVISNIECRERDSLIGDSSFATDLSVELATGDIVDVTQLTSGADLTQFAATIYDTAVDLSGATAGMMIFIAGAGYFQILEVAHPANWRITLDGAPGLAGPVEFIVYSRVWSAETWNITPNYTLGIATKNLVSGTCTLTEGSVALNDVAADFTKMHTGDFLFIVGNTLNAKSLYTIANIIGPNDLELNTPAAESGDFTYFAVGNEMLFGRGFMVTGMHGNHLEVAWAASHSWIADQDHIDIVLLDPVIARGNRIVTGALADFLATSPGAADNAAEIAIMQPPDTTPTGVYGITVTSFEGGYPALSVRKGQATIRGIQTSLASDVATITDPGFSAFNFIVAPSGVSGSYGADYILILDGPEAGTSYRILEILSATTVRLDAPSTADTLYGVPFMILPTERAYLDKSGSMVLASAPRVYPEYKHEFLISPSDLMWNEVANTGAIQPDAVTGAYCLQQSVPNPGTGEVVVGLKARAGMKLYKVGLVVHFATARSDPYSVGPPTLVPALRSIEYRPDVVPPVGIAPVGVPFLGAGGNTTGTTDGINPIVTLGGVVPNVIPGYFINIWNGVGACYSYEITNVDSTGLICNVTPTPAVAIVGQACSILPSKALFSVWAGPGVPTGSEWYVQLFPTTPYPLFVRGSILELAFSGLVTGAAPDKVFGGSYTCYSSYA